MLAPWKKSYDQPRQHIKKQRHYFANKGPSSESYGFSSSYVWMWELNYKKSSTQKNWCFWTVALEKTLESPLNCKEIQPVNPKGNQSWIFIGRTDAEAHLIRKTDSFEKTLMLGKIEGRKENGTIENEMVGWHHRIDGREFEWAPGAGDGGLACCSLWGGIVRQYWETELNRTEARRVVRFHLLCKWSDVWEAPRSPKEQGLGCQGNIPYD